MGGNEFIVAAKNAVWMYCDAPKFDPEDIEVVWASKTLSNCKGLFYAPGIPGLYFEATYNGEKDEIYLDVYEKTDNVVIVKNVED